MAKQPNILIFMVDQLAGTLFNDGPADFLNVPHLRKLSDAAVNFANCYCASPLCAPSRASFMSGRLPSQTGVYDNAAEFGSDIPCFTHALRLAGYRTALSGKMHFVGPDQLHGFEERLTTDIYPADFGWTPDWTKPDERIDWWYHNLNAVKVAGQAEITNQMEYDDEVAYHAKLKLYNYAREQSDQPFCLTVSFTHPHDPYLARPQYWQLYNEDKLPGLAVENMPYDQQDAHSKRLFDMSDWRNFDLSAQNIRDARHAYFANISYLDDLIGGILKTLDACQMSDDTIIMFVSDHGDMLGERGLWFKMSFYESSSRVPLFIHAPQQFKPARHDMPVSTLDVFPTLCDLAGAKMPPRLDGRSLANALNGDATPDVVVSEYAAEGSIDPLVMIRDGNYKYNHCDVDPPQLFDLSNDPNELNNIAGDNEVSKSFAAQVAQRWDLKRYRQDVLDSQQRRLMVYDALRNGSYYPWDFQPLQKASERYMRNHMNLNVLDNTSRFPRFGE